MLTVPLTAKCCHLPGCLSEVKSSGRMIRRHIALPSRHEDLCGFMFMQIYPHLAFLRPLADSGKAHMRVQGSGVCVCVWSDSVHPSKSKVCGWVSCCSLRSHRTQPGGSGHPWPVSVAWRGSRRVRPAGGIPGLTGLSGRAGPRSRMARCSLAYTCPRSGKHWSPS